MSCVKISEVLLNLLRGLSFSGTAFLHRAKILHQADLEHPASI